MFRLHDQLTASQSRWRRPAQTESDTQSRWLFKLGCRMNVHQRSSEGIILNCIPVSDGCNIEISLWTSRRVSGMIFGRN